MLEQGWPGLEYARQIAGGVWTQLQGTAGGLELLWTVPATFGYWRYVVRVRTAWRTLRTIQHEGENGALRLMARARLTRFLGLAVVFECWAAVGWIALMVPPNPAAATDDAAAWIPALLFFSAEAVLLLHGELQDIYQRAVVRLYEAQREAARRTRVLVVDDEPSLRAVLSEILTLEGYDVQAAYDGEDALSLAAVWHPAIVVIDLVMPRRDGTHTVAALKARDPGVKVLLYSAKPRMEELAQVASMLGADEALLKAASLDDILAAVARLAAAHG